MSISTMMRARMLSAVWPLLIWFWSAFSYGFCATLFSRVLLRLHWCVTWCMMNGYSVKAHGSVLMRVWASPYALQVLNYDAHVRSNCDAKMHACYACICVSLVTSYRIRIYMWLHCSWSTARDCEDMVAMSDIDVDVKYLDAKISWIFIVFMHKPLSLCLCWIGCVLSHLNIDFCIAREVPLMIVKIWLRCGACRLTWNMTYIWMRKYREILFKQYFGSYSAAADHPPPLLHRL